MLYADAGLNPCDASMSGGGLEDSGERSDGNDKARGEGDKEFDIGVGNLGDRTRRAGDLEVVGSSPMTGCAGLLSNEEGALV